MTLIYRTIWQDLTLDPAELLRCEFESWCGTKRIPTNNIPARGTWIHQDRQIEIGLAESAAGTARRCRLKELDNRRRLWTTTATSFGLNNDESWYWIDLECDDDSGARLEPPTAPRLARQLIDAGTQPTLDGLALTTKPTLLNPGNMASLSKLIALPGRTLGIVLLTENAELSTDGNISRATAVAHAVAGRAIVWFLPGADLREGHHHIPKSHAVWGGAARLYLPAADLSDPEDGYRHRYLLARQLTEDPQRSGRLVALQVAKSLPLIEPRAAWGELQVQLARPDAEAIARRVDELRARHGLPEDGTMAQLKSENAELLELLAIAEADTETLRRQSRHDIDVARGKLNDLMDELADTTDELESLTVERDNLLLTVRAMARGSGRPDDGETTGGTCWEDETASDLLPSNAIEWAKVHCQSLSIPDNAIRDIERLDQDLKARVWGSATLQALRALNEYAQSGANGFHAWATQTGRWPTSKLAMRESESVRNNPRFYRARVLPVSTELSSDGRLQMESHVKIQMGGGPNIPRLYFYDDVAGPTKKIHVGYYGPHDHMPNTRTN